MSEIATHLRALARTIGPRPATTDAEARAADYIEGVMAARGLTVERQEFDAPRTDAWALVVRLALTAAAALLARWSALPAVLLGVVGIVLLWLEETRRFTLAQVLPKGPSQNIIARHLPKARRGERLRRVVVVAHYDTARGTLLDGPSLRRRAATIESLTRACVVLVPAIIVVRMLPISRAWMPVVWYVMLAVAAVPFVRALIAAHGQVFGRLTDGANDNASGVAVMLGIMDRMVPAPTETPLRSEAPVRRNAEEAFEAGVVIEDALLEYTPIVPPEGSAFASRTASLFDGLAWDEDESAADVPTEPLPGQSSFEALDEEEAPGVRPADGAPSARRRSLFGRGDAQAEGERHGLTSWLGLKGDFDARRAGREIGSWDRLAEDDDEDDDFGFKGGSAGGFDFEDPSFAEREAARIRRLATSVDRALVEKEVWFVATGAKESGEWGMRALLDEHGDELRDAVILNLDSVGVGTLHWVTKEGRLVRFHGDRRLASAARRVTREEGLPVMSRELREASTDATFALARRFRALTLMAFDINGRVAHRHWDTDTVENVSEEALERASEFATKLIREL